MAEPQPTFFARLSLGFKAFWRALTDPATAAALAPVLRGEVPPAPRTEKPVLRETGSDAALQLLGLLQREGRFIDFLQENMAAFPDVEVGMAARVVHEGCNKVLREHLQVAPIWDGEEGSPVTVANGFDPASIRLTGNVVGQPPFQGLLAHRGWRDTAMKLPKVAAGHDLHILQPAEVEL